MNGTVKSRDVFGTDAFPASGKILFQSEGAEVYFRNIKLYPLR
jgi:hypothetical protein